MARPQQRYRGIRQRHWGSWVSEIRHPLLKTRIWLGIFETAEDAARAYNEAVRLMCGPRARTNFPYNPIASQSSASKLLSATLTAKLHRCYMASLQMTKTSLQRSVRAKNTMVYVSSKKDLKRREIQKKKAKSGGFESLNLNPNVFNVIKRKGVYPVKCNQDRFVVEDIVKFGSPFRFGLEAGSKPELLLAMSCLCKGNPDALLICNGFKDLEYISLALFARKLALNTVIVLEQEEELDLVVDFSQKIGVRPVIGVRAKLKTKHSSHFGSTSGEKGKFRLTTIQILRVVKKLDKLGMLDCFQLLHFHIGSQIPSTALLADGVSEASQIYCEMIRLGAHMKVIDIGGGLGIDYDGSKSSDSDISVSYCLEEYASAVVRTVRNACEQRSVKHPVICSESGRTLVSHLRHDAPFPASSLTST